MSLRIKVRRTTLQQLASAVLNRELLQGEPYWITDKQQLAIGIDAESYKIIGVSQGDVDVVNTSDGNGGFKETFLTIENEIIKNKYSNASEIAIWDDGVIDLKTDYLGFYTIGAELKNKIGGEFIPQGNASLVTKKWVEDHVSSPWIDLQTINDTEFKTTSQLSLDIGNAYDLALEVKWKYSVGTTRITGRLKAIASVYHSQAGFVLRTFIGNINVIEFNGVIVTNYDATPTITPMTAGKIIIENKSISFFNNRQLAITNNSGYDMEFMYRLGIEKY